MKQSIIAAAVHGLFAEATETPQSGGETPKKKKPLVEIPANVPSWLEQGKKEAARIVSAEAKTDTLAEEILLVYGEALAGQPGANDFLTGYATAWTNVNTAKVRKANAKSIFDCFENGDEMRSLVVGMNAETKEPIKEDRTIKEWLKGHNEIKGREDYQGYHGLLKLAVFLRGPVGGQGSGGGKSRKSTVTDKQQKEVLEARVPLMNTFQAASVIESATTNLAKQPNGETILFREITMICNKIKVTSQDKAALEVASQVFDIVDAHVQKMTALITKGQAPAAPATAVPPKPAEAPKPTQQTEIAKAA